MPDEAKSPKEFLIVSLPDDAQPGANLRLLGIANTKNAANAAVATLDSGTLGRVGVLERVALFVRRPAVENVEILEPISKKSSKGG
jgi:hypothetical protein